MFYLFVDFAVQLGLVCLLLTAFILAQLYLGTPRADGDTDTEYERATSDETATAVRTRDRIDERSAVPSRPAASLANVPMRRGGPRPKPVFGRKVNV